MIESIMIKYNGKLIELPRKGKALVITDLHGNLEDFNRFMNIWKKFKNRENHLILTGDFIHAMGIPNDNSIEILESVKFQFENRKNFHVLLGNHEWSAISHTPVFKAGVNQSLTFEDLLKERFGAEWKKRRDIYNEYFKTLPLAVKTANNVFISHAGPPKGVKSIDEIVHITDEGYSTNRKLFEILWNRYGDYSEEDINSFLKNVGCNVLIVGHTPVDGVEIIGKNQLVVSSSYSSGKKAYVELDLEGKIKTGKDVLNMVKFL
jgi:Icc-related predicted phosphoesterase